MSFGGSDRGTDRGDGDSGIGTEILPWGLVPMAESPSPCQNLRPPVRTMDEFL